MMWSWAGRDLEGDDTVCAGPAIDPCRRDPSVWDGLFCTSYLDADYDLLLLFVGSDTEGEEKEGTGDGHARRTAYRTRGVRDDWKARFVRDGSRRHRCEVGTGDRRSHM